jgi:hypothetical protein
MKKVLLSVMKKVILMTFLLTGGSVFSFADPLQVPMQIIKKDGLGNGNTLAPPRPWYITQNDYTLTMPAFEDDFTLELLDEDGAVVYSAFVPAGTTMIVLPSTLSGDFELRLVADTYYYRGYITL